MPTRRPKGQKAYVSVAAVTLATGEAEQILEARLRLLDNGYSPIACRDKRPFRKGWNSEVPSPDVIAAWIPPGSGKTKYPATGVLIENGLVAIDLDIADAALMDEMMGAIYAIAPAVFHHAPMRGRSDGSSPSICLFARRIGEPNSLNSHRWAASKEDETQKVEIWAGERRPGKGGQMAARRHFGVLGPHTVRDDGTVVRRYGWGGEMASDLGILLGEGAPVSLLDTRLDQLPGLTMEQAREICDAFNRIAEKAGLQIQQGGGAISADFHDVYDLDDATVFEVGGREVGLGELTEMASYLDSTSDEFRISGSFTGVGTGGTQDRCHVHYHADARPWVSITDFATMLTHRPVWREAIDDAEKAPLDFAPLMRILGDRKGSFRKDSGIPEDEAELAGDGDLTPAEVVYLAQEKMSPAAVATVLADRFEGLIRYVHDSAEGGYWLVYDTTHWRRDGGGAGGVRGLVGQACVYFSTQLYPPDALGRMPARRLATQDPRYFRAVEECLRYDARISTDPRVLDQQAWLLATPSQVIDLRTGKAIEPQPGHMITQVAACDMGEVDGCPQFDAHLRWAVHDEDEAEQRARERFLWQWIGSALVGKVVVQKLLFIHGNGGNGKGTITQMLYKALGKQYASAPMSKVFTEQRNEGHSTDKFSLVTARAVIGDEIPPNSVFDTSLLKQLTGGDPMSVRKINSNVTEATPVCTIILTSNGLPRMPEVDGGVRRRTMLMEFTQQFDPEQQEDDRAARLFAEGEGPGFLRRAMDGLLDLLANKLQVPASVRDATQEYLDTEDSLAVFLDAVLVRDPAGRVSRTDLVQRWETHARDNRARKVSNNALFAGVRRVFPDVGEQKSTGERYFTGVRFKGVEGLRLVKNPSEKP